jgi:hypothetical protein
MRPLEGNDVTDFYLAGGDLRAWVAFYLARLELDTTTPAPGWPKTLIFPALPGLAVSRDWRRLADGRIEATFPDAATLQACVDATRAIRAGLAI